MHRMSCFLSLSLGVMLITSVAAQQPKAKGLAELKTAPVGQRTNILKQLQSDPSAKILDVVEAMSDADPVQKNLLLGAAQSILARNPQAGAAQLQSIVDNKRLDAAARYWAFTELTRGDTKQRDAMLQSMLDDPSLELRYEAVKLAQSEVKGMKESGTEPAKVIASYAKLLKSARLPEQVQQIADAMKELGETVDLLNHFGFVSKWQVMASFDNRNKVGFNVEYATEKAYLASQSIDPKAEYDGKEGKKATWQALETKEADGAVDLNPVYSNEKGAVAYAYAEFNTAQAVECEVRLGCINANKVWVNGKQVMSNDVYHAGSQIDQYTAPVKLKAGKNTILVKVCQNEQTEQWAQDWKFQLRFSDPSGLAIASAK
ncbi:MAG: hypothetical protein SFV81_00310 [Pirellulaceae bacterium]|nr:hypothetical protein [Pirellulaceae bacterium]